MRRGIMKRLSKSATDLSSCRRRAQTTSPEEEQRELPGEQGRRASEVGLNDDGQGEEDDDEEEEGDEEGENRGPRPARSTPTVASLGRGGSSAGILEYLRQRLSGSTSAAAAARTSSSSSSATPEAARRKRRRAKRGEGRECPEEDEEEQFGAGNGRAEIVRYRRRAATVNDGNSLKLQHEPGTFSEDSSKAEVVRHVTPLSSLPAALAQELHAKRDSLPREVTLAAGNGAVVVGREQHASSSDSPSTEKVQKTLSSNRQSSSSALKGVLKKQPSMDLRSPPPQSPASAVVGDASSRPPMEKNLSQTSQGESSRFSSLEKSDDSTVAALRQHGQYLLHVHLKAGYDLAARDSNGTSDPYVKFLLKGKVQHKSRIIHKDLNPVWDERFVIAVDDPFIPLELKVRKDKSTTSALTLYPYIDGGPESVKPPAPFGPLHSSTPSPLDSPGTLWSTLCLSGRRASER